MQNMELQLRTIQVRRPQSRHFSVRNVPPGLRLAPGMSASFTVEYKPPKDASDADVVDVVTIWSEGASHFLECRAAVPRATFALDGDLDFGIVPTGSSITGTTTVKNTGQVKGDWALAYEGDLPIFLSPANGTLEPGDAQAVSVALKDVDAGQTASDLILTCPNEQPVKQAVKVTAVNTSIEILEADGRIVSQVWCRCLALFEPSLYHRASARHVMFVSTHCSLT